MYKIKTTKLFDKRFANLKKIFDLSDDEATDATETLKYTMILLQRDGKLPSNKDDFDNINDPNPSDSSNSYYSMPTNNFTASYVH